MNEIRDILSAAGDRVPDRPTPPFETIVDRARRRRHVIAASSMTGAVVTVAAAITIPLIVGASDSNAGHLSATRASSVPARSTGPVVADNGECAGLTVSAVAGQRDQTLRELPTTNTITVRVGQTVSFIATGKCNTYVRILAQTGDPVLLTPAPVDFATATSVTPFTAVRTGVEHMMVAREALCPSGEKCPLSFSVIANVAVTVDPAAAHPTP